MIPTTSQTREVHELYVRLTKVPHRYTMSSHFAIESWLADGYTADDLTAVVGYIWRRIKAGKRERESFKFAVLFGDRGKWDDDLSMARSESLAASKTVAMPSGRAAVMRSAGFQTTVDAPAKSAEQLLKESEFVKNHLSEWRKANPL
jgi:hypothetical protein